MEYYFSQKHLEERIEYLSRSELIDILKHYGIGQNGTNNTLLCKIRAYWFSRTSNVKNMSNYHLDYLKKIIDFLKVSSLKDILKFYGLKMCGPKCILVGRIKSYWHSLEESSSNSNFVENLFTKDCEHQCMLSSTTFCCWCADKRPTSGKYNQYIDGIGFITSKNGRSIHYCQNCRMFPDPNEIPPSNFFTSPSSIPSIPSSIPSSPSSIPSSSSSIPSSPSSIPSSSPLSIPSSSPSSIPSEYSRDCVICYDKISQYLFVPCGHLCLCEDCYKMMDKGTVCTICRSNSTMIIRVFNV
jgi:hypothetical protein